MPKGFARGWLLTVALAMPGSLFAQEVQQASAQQVLSDAGQVPTTTWRLPVSMNDGLPGESSWTARTMTQQTQAQVPASPAAAAMQVQPEAGCCDPEGEEGRGGRIRSLVKRVLDIPKQPWCNSQFFMAGQTSVEYVTGYFVSPIWVGSTRQAFFIPQLVRLGMMVTDPQPDRRFLKGSFEVLGELDCLPITSSVGNIVIGGSGILRYYTNPCKNQRYVPYIQAGFGGSYTDAYLSANSPTSSAFNFITQVGLGGHFFLTKRLAITSETNYYHISFPNQARSGDFGFNILGGTLGFTYFFK